MSISKKSELNNLKFSSDFFYDEVREGFYVSTMMKRYWASQLKVLSIIARICDIYGLRWFADYGTLLGAVRHGGYVPWDDDLDICMFRSDWLRFFDVAEKELPKGYKALTISKELEYNHVIGRVVNCDHIDYGKAHMDEFFGCPYTIGVDIFPLDGIYNDSEKEASRKDRAKKALAEMESYEASGRNIDPKRLKSFVKRVEELYMECPEAEAEDLALMPFYVPKDTHIFPKKVYEHIVKLPFENTYVNVPGRYEELLALEYGNFLNVNKAGGIHDYPVYAEQEKMLRDKLGANPFRYTFDAKELLGSVSRYAMRMLGQAGNAGGMAQGDTSGKESLEKKVVVFLPCRVSWWSTMEPLWRKYSADESVEVHVLPIFYFDCDHNGNIGEKHDERNLFPDYLNVEACEKFDFAGIHPDVIVMQVPYDGFNTALTVHEFFYSANLLNFTDELVYVPCFDMDAPMDENDKAATAISWFVEQKAVVNADRVVLKNEDLRKFYVNKLVELSGEDTRQYWEQKIAVMEQEVAENESSQKHDVIGKDADSCDGKRKTIVYYISISSLLKYGSAAIEKINENLDILEEAGDRIQTVFVMQEHILDDLKDWNARLYQELAKMLQSLSVRKNIIYDSNLEYLNKIDEWDAYYGDVSPYVRMCVARKIPVMIQNYVK